ncbi:MAG: SPOR domain-containing protein, partial [Spirochaetota bacterium]
MNRRLLLIITFLILVVGFCLGESLWEGSASMSRYGEFPLTGYYGASNSFPRNTLVEVENRSNEKTATVIIVDRLNDNG